MGAFAADSVVLVPFPPPKATSRCPLIPVRPFLPTPHPPLSLSAPSAKSAVFFQASSSAHRPAQSRLASFAPSMYSFLIMTATQNSRSPGAAPNKSLAFNEPSIPITPRGPPKLPPRKNSAHTPSTTLPAGSPARPALSRTHPALPDPSACFPALQTPSFKKQGGPRPTEDSRRFRPDLLPSLRKKWGGPRNVDSAPATLASPGAQHRLCASTRAPAPAPKIAQKSP